MQYFLNALAYFASYACKTLMIFTSGDNVTKLFWQNLHHYP